MFCASSSSIVDMKDAIFDRLIHNNYFVRFAHRLFVTDDATPPMHGRLSKKILQFLRYLLSEDDHFRFFVVPPIPPPHNKHIHVCSFFFLSTPSESTHRTVINAPSSYRLPIEYNRIRRRFDAPSNFLCNSFRVGFFHILSCLLWSVSISPISLRAGRYYMYHLLVLCKFLL